MDTSKHCCAHPWVPCHKPCVTQCLPHTQHLCNFLSPVQADSNQLNEAMAPAVATNDAQASQHRQLLNKALTLTSPTTSPASVTSPGATGDAMDYGAEAYEGYGAQGVEVSAGYEHWGREGVEGARTADGYGEQVVGVEAVEGRQLEQQVREEVIVFEERVEDGLASRAFNVSVLDVDKEGEVTGEEESEEGPHGDTPVQELPQHQWPRVESEAAWAQQAVPQQLLQQQVSGGCGLGCWLSPACALGHV